MNTLLLLRTSSSDVSLLYSSTCWIVLFSSACAILLIIFFSWSLLNVLFENILELLTFVEDVCFTLNNGSAWLDSSSSCLSDTLLPSELSSFVSSSSSSSSSCSVSSLPYSLLSLQASSSLSFVFSSPRDEAPLSSVPDSLSTSLSKTTSSSSSPDSSNSLS